MIDIPHLLNQVLIVLFPILIYQLFFNESDLKRRKPYSKLSLLLLIMLCLTMSFPIEIEEGYRYDFRIIPIIISFIYAGAIPGLIITTVSFIYRIFLGWDGIYNNLFDFTLVLTLITTLLVLLTQKYRLFTLRNKALVVSFIFLVPVIHRILYLYMNHQMEQLPFMIIFFIVPGSV